MTTAADAALLITGYQTESKELLAVLIARDKSFIFSTTATVSDFVEGSGLSLKGTDGGACEVNLRGSRFHYGDTREIPESYRESLEGKVAGILVTVLAAGECLYLVETSPES